MALYHVLSVDIVVLYITDICLTICLACSPPLSLNLFMKENFQISYEKKVKIKQIQLSLTHTNSPKLGVHSMRLHKVAFD